MARDYFKAMSDHELADRFLDISNDVDEFARVQWDDGQESSWPSPRHLLRTLENERRTKQNIIQTRSRSFCIRRSLVLLSVSSGAKENLWKPCGLRITVKVGSSENGGPTTKLH